MDSLKELFKKHHTDKYEHGYWEMYEDLFAHRRMEPLSILEIGTLEGASTMAFLEYFPNATIYCIDNLSEDGAVPIIHDRVYFYNANIYTRTWAGPILDKKFDLIINDAIKDIHILKQNFVIEVALALLNQGGYLVLEDQRLPYEENPPALRKKNKLSVNDWQAYIWQADRITSMIELYRYAQIFGYPEYIYDSRQWALQFDRIASNSACLVIQKP